VLELARPFMTRPARYDAPPSLSRPAGHWCSRALGHSLLTLGLAATTPSMAASGLVGMSLEDLMAVNVVGASKYEQSQRNVAAAVSIITREEIKTFGWRTIDEALASLPGVYVTHDRQYSYIGVRGFSIPGDYTTRLLIAINGNRLNEALYDGGPSAHALPIDIDLVERIEFIPGPGGAIYGQNAMLGVVNIVTRSGATVDGGEVSASYRWPQAERHARATWGKRLENDLDVLFSVSALRSRGETLAFDFGEAGVNGLAHGLDGEHDQDLYTRIARGPWTFELIHGDRRKNDPTGVYRSDPLVGGQHQSDRYSVAHLQYRDTLSTHLSLSARLFGTRYRYDSSLSFDGSRFRYPAFSEQHGAELQLISTALTKHTLLFGVEYQNNTRLDQYALDLGNPANDIAIERDSDRIGLYLQDEWQLGETLSTTLGLRMDRSPADSARFSPRLGLVWQSGPDTTLKALYGRAHREPNAYERDYYDGETALDNPDLEGETIDTLELVADHRVSPRFHLRASLFRWRIDPIIQLGTITNPDMGNGPPFLSQYQSGGKVQAQGVELSASHSWPQGARLRGSVTFQDLDAEYAGKIENSPHVLAKLNVSSPLPGTPFQLGYELRHSGVRFNEAGDRIAGYWLSNLHLVAPRIARGLDVSLSVLNLLDREYAHPSGGEGLHWQPAFEQDGRSVRLAVDYRF